MMLLAEDNERKSQREAMRTSIKFVKWLMVLAFIFFSFLMLQITLQYIPAKSDVAFLRIKQDVIGLWYYRVAFFTHVYSSMFVLIFGFVQFSKTVRKQYPAVHKWLGKLYVGIILFISGPSGLLMGYYGNGGWVAQIAFCLLAILWMFFTYKGFESIRSGSVLNHQKWMYRSYALTLSAISLRLWKWLIVLAFQPNPMDVYCIVAWLGWLGNLLVAEVLIYIFLKPKSASEISVKM